MNMMIAIVSVLCLLSALLGWLVAPVFWAVTLFFAWILAGLGLFSLLSPRGCE